MNTTFKGYYISLFLIITFLIFTREMSHATDTVNYSQIVRDNGTTFVSSGGIFELGFFSPENSKNRYVAIWYKKITVQTVVWIANSDNPLTDTSGALKVVEPGILALVNVSNGIIWSTNTSRGAQTPVAKLLDSGNLVVKDANDDDSPENFLWQSFDYPTDTFLPGMKLGLNFMTGLEVYLTSRRSSDNPAPGDYTFHLDPTGYPHIDVRKTGSGVVYRTGPWNGAGFGWDPRYAQNPRFGQNKVYTFGVFMSKEEVYCHYKQLNESIVLRFTLSESGVSHVWVWFDRGPRWITYVTSPLDNCDLFNVCGAYGSCNPEKSPVCGCLNKFEPKDPHGWDRGDWSNGCVLRTPLDCRGDVFLKYSGIKMPDTQHSWYNQSMSLEECRELCSKNCSCTAYSSLDISNGENGCLLWFGELVDIRKIYTQQNIYIRIASSELDDSAGKKGRRRKILLATLSPVFGISLLSLSLWLYFQKRKKIDQQQQETGRRSPSDVDNHHDGSHSKDLELPVFDLSIITKATDNFSINNKLGEGGFGPVYKGILGEGQEIAVKRLSRTSCQGANEFKNEVNCIAKLQHRNLVKLLGCCIEGKEKMLVYEYMSNKSLDSILFDPMRSILLVWPRRFNIINGIARGLMYLHQDSCLRVIHRDLKASNILLDSEMNPKISDFGLARTFGGNETEANTRRIVGTYGYMSPEYAVDGLFSVKSDVFSFGVLVLEIVSGKRNRGFAHSDHHLNLLGHAWKLYKEERSMELADLSLTDSIYLEEILRSIRIGLLCVQERPEDRPNMSSVVLMLSNDCVLPESKQPGFFTARDILEIETSVTTTSSKNTMSITLPEGR